MYLVLGVRGHVFSVRGVGFALSTIVLLDLELF